MGWVIGGVLIVLVSCAAYKTGYMQASIMADANWSKLVEENRRLREAHIKAHWDSIKDQGIGPVDG